MPCFPIVSNKLYVLSSHSEKNNAYFFKDIYSLGLAIANYSFSDWQIRCFNECKYKSFSIKNSSIISIKDDNKIISIPFIIDLAINQARNISIVDEPYLILEINNVYTKFYLNTLLDSCSIKDGMKEQSQIMEYLDNPVDNEYLCQILFETMPVETQQMVYSADVYLSVSNREEFANAISQSKPAEYGKMSMRM